MKNLIGKRITVICLAIISILELSITGSMEDSVGLWVLYGIYKVLV